MVIKAVSDFVEKIEGMRHDSSRGTQHFIEKSLSLLEEAIMQKRFEPECLKLFDKAERENLEMGIAFISNAEQRYLLELISKARLIVDQSIKELELSTSFLGSSADGMLSVSILLGAGHADKFHPGEKIKVFYEKDKFACLGQIQSVKVRTFGEITKLDLHGTSYYSMRGDRYLKSIASYYARRIGRNISSSEWMTIVRWKRLQH